MLLLLAVDEKLEDDVVCDVVVVVVVGEFSFFSFFDPIWQNWQNMSMSHCFCSV